MEFKEKNTQTITLQITEIHNFLDIQTLTNGRPFIMEGVRAIELTDQNITRYIP